MNRFWEELRFWILVYCIFIWSVNMYKNLWKRLLLWKICFVVIYGLREMVFIYVWGILFKEVGFICMVFYLLVKY